MAKIYGLFGSMTGKLADTVMSVRNGEQIARKYQPVVFNPSTPAQIATRAKLKLLSQLSAVMAPCIAIPREGNVSARNLFTKVNYGLLLYSQNEASVDVALLQLTKSHVALPTMRAVRETDTLTGFLTEGNVDVSRVVYCVFERVGDKLRFIGSASATEEGSGTRKWAAVLPYTAGEAVVYAYGVRDNTETARVKFANYSVVTATIVASLITTRALTETDITLTQTNGAIVETNRDIDPDEKKKTRKE